MENKDFASYILFTVVALEYIVYAWIAISYFHIYELPGGLFHISVVVVSLPYFFVVGFIIELLFPSRGQL